MTKNKKRLPSENNKDAKLKQGKKLYNTSYEHNQNKELKVHTNSSNKSIAPNTEQQTNARATNKTEWKTLVSNL